MIGLQYYFLQKKCRQNHSVSGAADRLKFSTVREQTLLSGHAVFLFPESDCYNKFARYFITIALTMLFDRIQVFCMHLFFY